MILTHLIEFFFVGAATPTPSASVPLQLDWIYTHDRNYLPSVATVGTPAAAFSWVVTGVSVQFTNESIGATDWLYDFGDFSSSTERDPSHVYATGGTYFVQLAINSGASLDSNMVTV